MLPRLLVAAVLIAAGMGAQQRPAAPSKPRIPVVVELFTSEGCSSCPSADALLASLDNVRPTTRGPRRNSSSEIEIITLGEHVDYWDHLGWKDSFSSPLFSTRQQDYGIAFRSGTVYTPQVVVGGRKDVLNLELRDLLAVIAEDSVAPRAETALRLDEDGTLEVTVGKLPQGSHRADVLLAIAESGIETDVRGGENTGRKLKHTAVVRMISKLAELDPGTASEYVAQARINLRPEWKRANVKLVLLVQDRENRRILGAASEPLAAPETSAKGKEKGRRPGR